MTIRRYLATIDLPASMGRDAFRESLEQVAREAHELGLRPVETWYSLENGHAFTLFDSDSEERIRELHRRVGLHEPRIMRVERVFTELLGQPYRIRR